MFSAMRIRVKARGVRVTRKSRTPVPRMGMMMAWWGASRVSGVSVESLTEMSMEVPSDAFLCDRESPTSDTGDGDDDGVGARARFRRPRLRSRPGGFLQGGSRVTGRIPSNSRRKEMMNVRWLSKSVG